jgi:intergrase/recombinase
VFIIDLIVGRQAIPRPIEDKNKKDKKSTSKRFFIKVRCNIPPIAYERSDSISHVSRDIFAFQVKEK